MEFLTSLIGPAISGIAKIFGGSQSDKNAKAIADQNIAAQKDFAQHGIQWKVEDAKAAGINPLAALGASTSSFSNIVGSSALGDAIGSAGQDIGRAVAAATAQPSRQDQLQEKLLEAKIANVNADTVRMTAAASAMRTKLGQPGTGPGVNVPFPTPDPRGPVINLMQRAKDPRTGEIVWIPSEQAASPLQTLAASPLNVTLGAKSAADIISGGPPEWKTGGFLSGNTTPENAVSGSQFYNNWFGAP